MQDNLRSSTVGARTATHAYDANNRLASVSGTGVNLGYGYDANGNIVTRGSQGYSFDLGNRMKQATGVSTYAYDGEGMRTTISNSDASTEVQVYSHAAGRLLYAKNTLGSVAASVSYSCPSGQTLSGTNCLSTSTSAATVTAYSCPSGQTLSGSTCTLTTGTTVAATVSGYSCPSGQTVSGSSCLSTTTVSASVASYSCPANYTLSGSTCSLTTTTTSAATASYSCPAGQTLSGTSCIRTSTAAATPVYSCSAGYTLSGTNCNGTTSAAATGTPSCNGHGTLTSSTISSTGTYCLLQNYSYKVYPDPEQNCAALATSFGLVMDPNSSSNGTQTFRCILTPKITYSCPSGGTLSGTSCITPVTVAATVSGYTCSSGTLSGSSCITTSSSAATVTYSCSAGTLSGSTCTQSSTATVAGTPNYSCSAGYTLSGSSCSQTTTSSATPVYTCPSGSSLSGSSCTSTTTTTAAATPTYGCPNGGALSGSSCMVTTSTAATPGYSCPGGGTVSGSTCTSTGAASTTKYVYLGAKLIAEDDSAAGVSYSHTDALGSPVARTNGSGVLLSRTRFEPYGNVAAGFNPTRPNSTGFTGHVNDANTGLTYMQARYYDPMAGRLMSVDPVVADGGTGASFNRYEYANSSPYKYIDPTGQIGALPEQVCGGQGSCTTVGSPATKVYGTPQNTRAKGSDTNHAEASRAVGEAAVASGKAESVHYNQSLTTVSGNPEAGRQQPDVSIKWRDGGISTVEIVSPSQSVESQITKGIVMQAKLGAIGQAGEPNTISMADALAGRFTLRASGALSLLGLIRGMMDIRQAEKENPNLSFIERQYIMIGMPLPKREYD